MMRKAITIDVRLYIEAEQEAARDFAASTGRAVREMIRAGAAKHPELKVRVKHVREADPEE